MSLPKIDLPRYKHYLKGLDKTVTYRPFTTKEQKILLNAKDSEDGDQIVEAVKQIIELCIKEDIDVDDMPIFDIEDMFMRIRAKSVGEEITIRYKVKNSDKRIKVDINIDDIKVEEQEGHTKKLQLSDSIGAMMRYPTYKIIAECGSDDELVVQKCIDYIFDNEEVHHLNDYSQEEIDDWFESLDIEASTKITQFFQTMPKLRYETEVDVGEGQVEKLVYTGLQDFFI